MHNISNFDIGATPHLPPIPFSDALDKYLVQNLPKGTLGHPNCKDCLELYAACQGLADRLNNITSHSKISIPTGYCDKILMAIAEKYQNIMINLKQDCVKIIKKFQDNFEIDTCGVLEQFISLPAHPNITRDRIDVRTKRFTDLYNKFIKQLPVIYIPKQDETMLVKSIENVEEYVTTFVRCFENFTSPVNEFFNKFYIEREKYNTMVDELRKCHEEFLKNTTPRPKPKYTLAIQFPSPPQQVDHGVDVVLGLINKCMEDFVQQSALFSLYYSNGQYMHITHPQYQNLTEQCAMFVNILKTMQDDLLRNKASIITNNTIETYLTDGYKLFIVIFEQNILMFRQVLNSPCDCSIAINNINVLINSMRDLSSLLKYDPIINEAMIEENSRKIEWITKRLLHPGWLFCLSVPSLTDEGF